MNVNEINARLAAIKDKHGVEAEVWFGRNGVQGGINFHAFTGGRNKNVLADQVSLMYAKPEEILAKFDEFEAKLVAALSHTDEKLLKRIALRIIERTHEFGECTDRQFSDIIGDNLLPRYREKAEALANEMAQSGQPFKISDGAKPNGAPAEPEDDSNIPF